MNEILSTIYDWLTEKGYDVTFRGVNFNSRHFQSYVSIDHPYSDYAQIFMLSDDLSCLHILEENGSRTQIDLNNPKSLRQLLKTIKHLKPKQHL